MDMLDNFCGILSSQYEAGMPVYHCQCEKWLHSWKQLFSGNTYCLLDDSEQRQKNEKFFNRLRKKFLNLLKNFVCMCMDIAIYANCCTKLFVICAVPGCLRMNMICVQHLKFLADQHAFFSSKHHWYFSTSYTSWWFCL